MPDKAESEIIGVVLARPGEPAKATIMENTLASLQGAVGGWVEPVVLGQKGAREIIAWVNEEGLLDGLPWNRALPGGQPLAGPIVVTGSLLGPEGRETTGLTVSEAQKIVEFLDTACRRMDPTPSSMDEFERITGRAAVEVWVEDANGQMRKVDPP